MSGDEIRSLLEGMGAVFEPLDERAKHFGIFKKASTKFQTKKRLSNDEKGSLAFERRRILRRATRNTNEPLPSHLAEFHDAEVKRARKSTGRDLATDAWKEIQKQNKLGNPNAKVFFIPSDGSKLYKKWDDFDNFRLFVRRHYYRKALDEELKHGRFVVATKDPTTNALREDKNGKPIINAELGGKRATRKKVVKPKAKRKVTRRKKTPTRKHRGRRKK